MQQLKALPAGFEENYGLAEILGQSGVVVKLVCWGKRKR